MIERSKSYIATAPGATIKEQLNDRGMSQKEFASRMEMSEKHISKLVNGDVQLTPDVAMRLEMVLGVPARFWNNLEATYREKLTKIAWENQMDADIETAKKFPYKEMAKNNWVPDVSDAKEKVFALRKFFEVVHLGLLNDSLTPSIAYRRLFETEKGNYALLAWAQKAKLEARSITTGPIDIRQLGKELESFRHMTAEDPLEFCPKLHAALANCGVALTFLPHFGGSFLHGATFCDGNKIVMGLTVRGKDADKFWFSLFHELGHIILGHIYRPNGTSDEDEGEADAFARNTLIPDDLFSQFVACGNFQKHAIIRFADSLGVDCGIVVGRLQKEGHLPYKWHNDLKTRYSIAAY